MKYGKLKCFNFRALPYILTVTGDVGWDGRLTKNAVSLDSGGVVPLRRNYFLSQRGQHMLTCVIIISTSKTVAHI